MSHVCRTCLNIIENGSQLFSLETNEPAFDRLQIKTKLETCVPEIILHRVRNSVMCSYCFYALNTAYDFKTRCLQTETQIFEFIRRETVDSIDLSHYIKRSPDVMPPVCDTFNQRDMMMGRDRPILLSPPLVLQQMPPLTVAQSLPPPLHPLGPSRMLPPQPHPLLPFVPRPLPPLAQSMPHPPHQFHPPHQLQSPHQPHPAHQPPPNQYHPHLLSRLLTRPTQLRQQLNHNVYNSEPPPLRYHLAAQNQNAFVLSRDNLSKCSLCQQSFASGDLLREHMSCHINPEQLRCTMCDFQTNSASTLDDHLKSHNGLADIQQYCMVTPAAAETNHTCSSCSFTTTDKAAYKEHKATHAPEQLHQCGLCNFRSTHSSSLRRHMKVHMGDRPYRCNECRFGAADEAALQVHAQIHSIDRAFKCSDCPHTANKKSKLRHHVMQVHPDNLQSFLATELSDDAEQITQKSVRSPRVDPFKVSLADIHSILQEDEDDSSTSNSNSNPAGGNGLTDDMDVAPQDVDPFMVTVDDIQKVLQGKSVDFEPDLDDGECILVNNGDADTRQTSLKFYRCSICRQAFKFRYQLRKHMNVHISNNKAPLRCSKCDFRTMAKSQFMVHMKLHNGGKIFRCDQCKYLTVSWGNLQKHNKIHISNKKAPYKCTECDYQTTKNAALRNHMTTAHIDIEPFRCADCPFGTNNEETLLSHIELHSMGNHFIDNVTSSSFIEDTIKSITNHFLQDDDDIIKKATVSEDPNMTVDDLLETPNQNHDMVVVPTQDLTLNSISNPEDAVLNIPNDNFHSSPVNNDQTHQDVGVGGRRCTPTDDFHQNNLQTLTAGVDDRILDSATGNFIDKLIGNDPIQAKTNSVPQASTEPTLVLTSDASTPDPSTDGFVSHAVGNDLDHSMVGANHIPEASTDDFGSSNHQT